MNAETIKDCLRRWMLAFTGGGIPFNHEATTANESEFNEAHALMLKAQGYMREKGFVATSKGQAGQWVQITCLQYKFKVTYKRQKHINQTATAIQTYHETKGVFSGQELALARFILASPAPVSVRMAVEHFRANPGEGGPDELNTGSRAMNTLKREGAKVDGVLYWLQCVETKPNAQTGKPADFFRLMPAGEVKAREVQKSLFE